MEEKLEFSYLDGDDVVDDVVGVDFNIVTHLHRQLQIRTSLAAITMLCIVTHVLNILNIYSNHSNIGREFVSDKDRRRE